MQVLLTGVTGFVGYAVAKSIINQGHCLKVLVRKKTNFHIKKIEQHNFNLENLEHLSVDIFSNVDCVIHSAARAHILNDSSSNSLVNFRKINRDATIKLAEISSKKGVKRFVFLSSIGVHGTNSYDIFSESSLINPQNAYAQSKIEAEYGLLKIANSSDMEVVIIRPPLVYGLNAPGNFGLLVKWVKKSLPMPFGAINNLRSFIALENLVDFILLCADRSRSPLAINQVFLIADGEDVSTTSLLHKVADAYGVKSRLLPIPIPLMRLGAKFLGKSNLTDSLFGNLKIDSSKARKLLGWKPIVTMDEQLKKMAEYDVKEKNS